MHGSDNRLLYWLFFCTNDLRGLEVMKPALKKVDTSGGYFSFSDARSPSQLTMLDRCDDAWLGTHLRERLAARDVTVREIGEHVLVETPLVSFRSVLATLERDGRIAVPSPPPGRRKGAFKDPAMIVRFPPVSSGAG